MRPHARPPWWPEDEPWPPRRWELQHRRLHQEAGAPRRGEPPTTDPGDPEGVGPAGDGGPPARRPGWDGQEWWGSGEHGGVRRGFGCLIALMSTMVVSVGV